MAYRADIEIAVKGAQELKRLQDQVRATSKLVDGLNNYLENIGGGGIVRSIDNLNKAVADTAKAFNKAALETDEAALAARNFVTANRQLTQGLEERLTLLKSITEQERRQRLSAAGIRETTQYGGAIGPGPASPVGSLVGQKSPVEERIRRTIQARQDESELQQALLRLEQKSVAEANKKLESQEALIRGKREVLALSEREAARQKFLAGTSGTAVQGPLAGPGAMGFPVALSLSKVEQEGLATAAKKQAILQRMVATRQALAGLAANLQRLELNSVVAIADATRNQEQLNAAKARQLALTQQIRASEGAASNAARQRLAEEAARRNRIQNAGFGVQGPALPPREGNRRGGGGSRVGGAISGSIIGGAFPLLFGQGAGAATGGAVGGLVGGLAGPGGSFAGSLLGTLLGDIAEQGGKIKELADDIGFSADQTTRLQQAFALAGQEADKFQAAVQNIRGLGLTLDDQADAIALAANLTEAYGGKIDKIAAAYANFVEKGKVGISDINKFTSEGIPILDELEKKYATNRDGILQLAKDGKISAQDLSDALINIGNSSDTAVKKTVSGWDKAWADIKAGGSLLVQAVGAYFGALTGSASSSTGSIAASFASMFKNIVQNSIDATAALARNLANLARFAANLSATVELGGLNIGATASKNIAKNVEKTARDFDASLQKIQLPTPGTVGAIAIPGQAPAAGGGGGKSAADKAAEDAARLEQQTQERLRALTREAELTRQIGTVKELQFRAEMDGNKELQIRLQGEERIIQIMQATSQALDGITDQRLRQAVLSKAATEIDAARQETMFEMERLESERTKAYEQIITDLNLELALKTATTEQAREQLRLEAELAKLKGQGFTDEQISAITGLQAQVTAPLTDAQNIEQRIGKLKDEVAELTNIGNIAINVADGIGTAFSQAFAGLISGSMSAREALSGFFKSVGDMFVEMAAQIIAKQMTMIILQTILKALGAMGGGGGGFSGDAAGFGGSFDAGIGSIGNTTDFSGGFRATGGPVTSQQPYIVGERGPELFVPGTGGSVVNNNDLRSAMGAAPGSGGGSPVLNMSFQSTNINGVEYVSRDQLEQAMAETRRQASRDGAQRGMTMTLDKLQQSPSTRSRVGMR